MNATRACSPCSSISSSVSDTGTPAARSSKKNSTSTAVQERQLLEQHHILFVLQQRAMQDRNGLLRIIAAQRLGCDVLRYQQLDPVEQLRGGGLLPQPRCFADTEESRQRLGQQCLLEAREMHLDDAAHRGFVRKAD